jgi:retron-type reverse transcriptase
MRCTGRPRPIPDVGSTRCDKVRRRDVLRCAWAAVRANNGAPGIDKITLAAVGEYGIDRLLGELAAELEEGRYRPLPARRVYIPSRAPASRGRFRFRRSETGSCRRR